MDIANLKTLLKKHGVSQTDLAILLGRDKAVITNLMQGKRALKAEEAMTIARHLGVQVAEILGEKPAAKQSGFSEQALIPFQQAPVKTKSNAQVVQKSGRFFLQDAGVEGRDVYALEVRDESLNLAGFMPGDIVISDLAAKCRAGQVVVVQHYKGKGAQTLLRKYEPPYLMPHSADRSFKPLREDDESVRIVSPVVKLIRLL